MGVFIWYESQATGAKLILDLLTCLSDHAIPLMQFENNSCCFVSFLDLMTRFYIAFPAVIVLHLPLWWALKQITTGYRTASLLPAPLPMGLFSSKDSITRIKRIQANSRAELDIVGALRTDLPSSERQIKERLYVCLFSNRFYTNTFSNGKVWFIGYLIIQSIVLIAHKY